MRDYTHRCVKDAKEEFFTILIYQFNSTIPTWQMNQDKLKVKVS